MTFIYNKIIDLEKEYALLSKDQFKKKDVTRETVKYELEKSSEELRQISFKVKDILNEHVYPYLKEPTTISKEIAVSLEELAEKLSGYGERVDTGLSYDIRCALIEYAKYIGDEELLIRNLFFKGLCMFFLNKELFNESMSNCYDEIISLSSKYESFSKETRNLIVRAYGNAYVSVPSLYIHRFFKNTDSAKDFWKNTAQKVDPDFNWEAFYYNIDENTCTMCATYLRDLRINESKSEEIVSRLYESAKKIYDKKTSDENALKNISMDKSKYYYEAGKYYKGLSSERELCTELYKMFYAADKTSYTSNNIFLNLQMPSLFLYYLAKMPDAELLTEQNSKTIKNIEETVFSYVKNLPIDFSQEEVTRLISNFTIGMFALYDSFEFLRTVLSLTIYRHKPTFTHSVVVAKISTVITKYIVDNCPEYFVGVKGLDNLESVEKYKKQIEEFVWFAGLSHDMGKIGYTNMISLYVRKLNDIEFNLIKQHPDSYIAKAYFGRFGVTAFEKQFKSARIVNNFEFLSNSQAAESIIQISYGHHISFDEKRGYPQNFSNEQTRVKKITDIISIADCLDAATDTVGRSYAKGKTPQEILSELIQGAGTAYSPFIVDLLKNNKDLFDKIVDVIENYRYDVYLSCFDEESITSDLFMNYKHLD